MEQDYVGSVKEGISEEEAKVFLIPCANAIVDPDTVVIHSENTSTTFNTMMGTGWFPSMTLITFLIVSLVCRFFVPNTSCPC
jgi:hypothetical protein